MTNVAKMSEGAARRERVSERWRKGFRGVS